MYAALDPWWVLLFQPKSEELDTLRSCPYVNRYIILTFTYIIVSNPLPSAMIYLFWFMDSPHIIPLSLTLPHSFQKIWTQGNTQNCAVHHTVHCSTQYILEVLPHLDKSSHWHHLHYLWVIPCPYFPTIGISPSYNPPFQTSINLIQFYQVPSCQDPHHQY